MRPFRGQLLVGFEPASHSGVAQSAMSCGIPANILWKITNFGRGVGSFVPDSEMERAAFYALPCLVSIDFHCASGSGNCLQDEIDSVCITGYWEVTLKRSWSNESACYTVQKQILRSPTPATKTCRWGPRR